MGYTTDFDGEFKVNKPVNKKTYDVIKGLNETRRMRREGLEDVYGVEGEFYVEDDNKGVVDHNSPPKTQPSLWCGWEIKDDKQTIKWDGVEKFYGYVEWIEYIIAKILEPQEYLLKGIVSFQGEESSDIGKICIENNKVTVIN